jgi:thiamine biosynthesis lipoprotein
VTAIATPQVWPVRRKVEHLMGMPISLALRGRHASTRHGEAAWAEVLATLHEVDRVFSTFRADSFVSRLGRGEIEVADCPHEVAEVLALGERARFESGGAFDVARCDSERRRFLDPSGVVKGWAVDRAAATLHALDDTDFCLSAGGDMVAHVADPARPDWRVGIEDPFDSTRIRAVVPLRDGAVATSGLAHRGPHIVDARSGVVPTRVASVTVVGDDLTWADIDATAAFALDGDAAAWLARRPRRALVLWADGRSETVPRSAAVPH